MSQPPLHLLPGNRPHFAALNLLEPSLHFLLPGLLHVSVGLLIQLHSVC